MALNNLQCGNNGCLGGAGDIILKGYAGRGANLVVGFFYHQIRIAIKEIDRPGGAGGPIPIDTSTSGIDYTPERDDVDHNKVKVDLSIKWHFMKKSRKMSFIMERRWANVIVNRINQINTFNEQFSVKYSNLKNNFRVKIADYKEKFGVKWKK